MRVQYEIVNPATKQQGIFYKIERHFLRSLNVYLGLAGIHKLKCPLRYIPMRGIYDKFFEYEIKDDETVYCYWVDISRYNDTRKYEKSPFSEAELIHTFKFAINKN